MSTSKTCKHNIPRYPEISEHAAHNGMIRVYSSTAGTLAKDGLGLKVVAATIAATFGAYVLPGHDLTVKGRRLITRIYQLNREPV